MPLFRRATPLSKLAATIRRNRFQIAAALFMLVIVSLGEYFYLHKVPRTNTLVRRETQGRVDYPVIRDQVQQYLDQKQVQYSFFFEYIPSHISIKLDSDQLGKAASLLKLPTAMNLYRQAELGNVDLHKTITLQQSWLDSNFGTLYQRGAGYKLTLGDALRIMITKSDNTALHAVQANIPERLSAQENVSDFLDLPIEDGSEISSEAYSDYLRCLYYSCFLKEKDSEQLLSWLRDTHFPGIKDGVPSGVPVADKIGQSEGGSSDCGIVYAPGNTYLLCIMLRGDDPNLPSYLGAISRMVYDGVVNGSVPISGAGS